MRKKRKRRGRAAALAEAKQNKQKALEADGAAAAEGDPEVEAEPEAVMDGEHEAEAEPEPEPEPEPELEPEVDLEAHRVWLKGAVESLLFAADRPLTVKQLRSLVKEPNVALVEEALGAIEVDYAERGIVLHSVAGGYQLRTHPRNSEVVKRLVEGRPVRLTRAQLETLSIIAYRQPITRPEIDDIRGVDTGGTLKVLFDRSLIRVLGKKEEPGRPLLYGTTREFLEFFNLNDLRDLPTLREYHELTEDSIREVERLDAEATDDEATDGEATDGEAADGEATDGEATDGEPDVAEADSDAMGGEDAEDAEDAEDPEPVAEVG